ncbi:hypothetical protein MJO28_010264 [Puccinia striiformis f. sp. tritici]|uniref:Uncharacterized protein n=1 Tax=Puccinia striiformis f. sp. tritici TaxID=168172 RepID=A0ACC0E627_9BASI|nr:hypothetical protein MJO28_010264 [Puccinia striiformis f. sp. tritici]
MALRGRSLMAKLTVGAKLPMESKTTSLNQRALPAPLPCTLRSRHQYIRDRKVDLSRRDPKPNPKANACPPNGPMSVIPRRKSCAEPDIA